MLNLKFVRVLLFVSISIICIGVSAKPLNQDKYVGYYYPEITSAESYSSRATELPNTDSRKRILFVTGVSRQFEARAYAPDYALLAKSDRRDKLIIVVVREGVYDTIYRIRGMLGELSSIARSMPIFQEHKVEDLFTFFDLLVLLGFKQVTITNGKDITHQVIFE